MWYKDTGPNVLALSSNKPNIYFLESAGDEEDRQIFEIEIWPNSNLYWIFNDAFQPALTKRMDECERTSLLHMAPLFAVSYVQEARPLR